MVIDAYLHDELLVQKLSFVVIYKITHFTLLYIKWNPSYKTSLKVPWKEFIMMIWRHIFIAELFIAPVASSFRILKLGFES